MGRWGLKTEVGRGKVDEFILIDNLESAREWSLRKGCYRHLRMVSARILRWSGELEKVCGKERKNEGRKDEGGLG